MVLSWLYGKVENALCRISPLKFRLLPIKATWCGSQTSVCRSALFDSAMMLRGAALFCSDLIFVNFAMANTWTSVSCWARRQPMQSSGFKHLTRTQPWTKYKLNGELMLENQHLSGWPSTSRMNGNIMNIHARIFKDSCWKNKEKCWHPWCVL